MDQKQNLSDLECLIRVADNPSEFMLVEMPHVFLAALHGIELRTSLLLKAGLLREYELETLEVALTQRLNRSSELGFNRALYLEAPEPESAFRWLAENLREIARDKPELLQPLPIKSGKGLDIDISGYLESANRHPHFILSDATIFSLSGFLNGLLFAFEHSGLKIQLNPDLREFERWLIIKSASTELDRWDRCLLFDYGCNAILAFDRFFETLTYWRNM